MDKKIIIRTACFILAAVVMVFIFMMSAQTADISSDTSKGVTRIVAEIVVKDFEDMTLQEQESVIGNLHLFVRKAAHFSIFAILAALFAVAFYTFDGIRGIKRFLIPFVCSAAYAASDEFHQSFVVGRSCEFRDFCIDSSGAVLGILFVLLLFRLINKKK